MSRRPCDSELRLGLAKDAERLGEQLLWSVNKKQVQSKQYPNCKACFGVRVFFAFLKKA